MTGQLASGVTSAIYQRPQTWRGSRFDVSLLVAALVLQRLDADSIFAPESR